MGAKPSDIRVQIAQQRERMAPKLAQLQGRIQADIQDASGVAQQRVSQVRGAADRRFAFIGGLFFAGLLAGVLVQGRRHSHQREKERLRLLQESARSWRWGSGWPDSPPPRRWGKARQAAPEGD